MTTDNILKLKVIEALGKDVGRAFARIGPEDFEKLGLAMGDIVEISGKSKTVCKAMLTYKEFRGQSCIQLDGVSRENSAVSLGEHVVVRKVDCRASERVILVPLNLASTSSDMEYVGRLIDGLPVITSDRIRVNLFGSRSADFKVKDTLPKGAVVINPTTKLVVESSKGEIVQQSHSYSYEDIGGLKPQLRRIREMIELPLRYPEVFERLGVDAPKGVLLYGPPGSGKTLIARAIAHETDAAFFSVSGPEIVHKFYGESEAHLREIFEKAAKQAPSIIFLDEIDAIAPKRDQVVGDVEKRIVAQLLALMDGLNQRQRIIVIGATNLPNALDQALRRPGRFDREISIAIPDRNGRLEILEIHSRGMPLSMDVDITHLADITHGFVGADLEVLCKEAAMTCLRTILPDIDFGLNMIPYEQLAQLEITMADFLSALCEVEPSVVREIFVDVPNVGWNDVGGHKYIKERLIEAVEWPLKFADIFKEAGIHPPKGILLVGPPGCGKTLLAKAVASESGVNFISVKGSALLSKYVGDSEKGVREVFNKAKQASPCIIFFDEVDALVPVRQHEATASHVMEGVLSQFLAEFDGIEELKNVLVLGATNRMDMLDPAVLRPGRFDEIIEIGIPTADDRKAIFQVHTSKKPLSPEIKLDELVKQTEHMSGAEIASICNRAALIAVRRVVHGSADKNFSKVQLTKEDFSAVIQEMQQR
ncbi:MAG: AAA family ATPase [Legionellales bacterium RIFCSPHIGHO2_12_FULL_42_9]|nr:MAG: AAA family ATPase [Legionellales bacterium RIFCSPHIGHO2_12_FULL_42_9]